jgi:hypothetical protein
MPKKVSKSIKQKQKQSQSVNIKIGVPEQKPKRAPRKPKKSISIINTGPIISTPSFTNNPNPISYSRHLPHHGMVGLTKDDYISYVNRGLYIPADQRLPNQPLYEPWAYDSGFQQGGSGPGFMFSKRPQYTQDFSDIEEVPSPYKNRSPSIYSINSDESSQWVPESFRSISSQNISSGLGLEQIRIPQQGMGISSSPVKLEDYGKASYQDLQNTVKSMSQADYSYGGGGGGFSDDQIQAALTYNSLTPVKSEAESKIDYK